VRIHGGLRLIQQASLSVVACARRRPVHWTSVDRVTSWLNATSRAELGPI
jgi:hypothetical protein